MLLFRRLASTMMEKQNDTDITIRLELLHVFAQAHLMRQASPKTTYIYVCLCQESPKENYQNC